MYRFSWRLPRVVCVCVCEQSFRQNTSVMAFFPPVALRPDVTEHLKNTFTNQELVAKVGEEAASEEFDSLLSCLSHPPSFTCVRVNTHLADREQVQELLHTELSKQQLSGCHGDDPSLVPVPHPLLPDVLLLPIIGPRCVSAIDREVVVGVQCGNAVLRGAHVFAPGIVSAPMTLQVGDTVSVYSDVEGRCCRGAKSFDGQKVFLGNGVCEMGRHEVFRCTDTPRGLAVRMTDRLYSTPCFDKVLTHLVFLQNLPSVVVSHVLDPQPGECVLDMCAAPGGKTTHIAALMRNQGLVIALDKISSKIQRVCESAASLQLDCIKAFCCNSIHAAAQPESNRTHAGPKHSAEQLGCTLAGGPPFPEQSFDRVLLDAPCSALGQRPNMSSHASLKEIRSYQPLQRKLLTTAVCLLKTGGVLVYSTCTVTLAENEEQVAWALKTFPCLTLEAQEPHLGEQGMLGAGLSHDQRRKLQRFWPRLRRLGGGTIVGHSANQQSSTDSLTNPSQEGEGLVDGHAQMPRLHEANSDTIGFFIAKFRKS
ncbi:tRNA (cytosine(72)-C(5))-methyltransferase NSUN6 [Engraulis encrasicolus]|uniref:tRNA (cytosine(72)-C(5))-methyltransferase NSUN6 n=1 Tax=Engraulis encrasicolus TaxID=184585 RepID=UPI002FD3A96D